MGENDDFPGSEKTIVKTIRMLNPDASDQSPALLFIAGPQIGRSIPIEKNEFIIGRVDSCDLKIEDDLVSRNHCKIIKTTNEVEIHDLGSTNGTLVNGQRIETATLKENDKIQVGSSTIFKFHLQEDVEKQFLGELFKAATKDFLTHVYNKGYFLDRLQSEFSYSKRRGGDLSVLVMDVDHFKKINDTHGHLVGDIALQKLGHYLLSHTRKDDVVARFGGEEFVMLLRDCEIEKAKKLGELLREGISKITVKTKQAAVSFTVSIGVASLTNKTNTKFEKFETLLEHADIQLYRAKEAGRNRVCF